jgi:hypothetical protein
VLGEQRLPLMATLGIGFVEKDHERLRLKDCAQPIPAPAVDSFESLRGDGSF